MTVPVNQKSKLISLSKDAKHAHRLWSSWISVLVILVSVLEAVHVYGVQLLPIWRDVIPQDSYPIVVASLATAGFVARFLKQSWLAHPTEEGDKE